MRTRSWAIHHLRLVPSHAQRAATATTRPQSKESVLTQRNGSWLGNSIAQAPLPLPRPNLRIEIISPRLSSPGSVTKAPHRIRPRQIRAWKALLYPIERMGHMLDITILFRIQKCLLPSRVRPSPFPTRTTSMEIRGLRLRITDQRKCG